MTLPLATKLSAEAQKPSFCLKTPRVSDLPLSPNFPSFNSSEALDSLSLREVKICHPVTPTCWPKFLRGGKLGFLSFFTWYFSHTCSHWIVPVTPQGRYSYYPCLTDEDVEVTRFGSRSGLQVAKWQRWGFNAGSLTSPLIPFSLPHLA